MSKRNIFILANNIEELGGVQRVVHLLAEGFAQRGHSVELIGLIHPDEPAMTPLSDRYSTSVLYDERRPPKGYFPKTLGQQLNLRGQARELRRRAMRRQAVAELSRRFRAAGEGIVIASQVYSLEHVIEADLTGMMVIGQYHDSYAAAQSSADHRRIMRSCADIDAFLLLTARDAALFERDGLNNVGVMHNPLSFYPEATSSLDSKVVITAGRYHEQKALDQLIDAWAIVHRSHPDWELRMFGSGPLEGQLRDQIDRLGLAGSARLMGPTGEIQKELLASSVYAMSSRHEGLPMVLTEAMACGVPCVAYDCAPGIREIITDGVDGLVVRHNDVNALAAGINTLIEDESLRRGYGKVARDSVRRFQPDHILDQWERLFRLIER